MTSTEVLRARHETEAHLAAIIEAADTHRDALGFLPHAVYGEGIERERIWVAVHEGRYCGHLFFGGARPMLKVKQLFVAPEHRRQGLARRLIEALTVFAAEADYGSIRARVADDLDANAAWQRLGFTVGQVVAGGRTTGRSLLVRYRRVRPAGPQLDFLDLCDRRNRELTHVKALGQPVNRTECYTVDLNIWLDFLRERAPHHAAVHALIQQAARNQFRLRITDEFKREAQRTARPGRPSDPLLTIALAWPTLPAAEADAVDRLAEELRSVVFPGRSLDRRRAAQDRSDLRHLALSILGGATGFITRDAALLGAAERIVRHHGFQIVAPVEVIDEEPPVSLTPPLGLDGGAPLRLEGITTARSKAQALIERVAAFAPGRRQPLDAEADGRVCCIGDVVAGVVHWPRATSRSPAVELIIEGPDALDATARQQTFDLLIGWLLLQVRASRGMTRVLLRVDLATAADFARDIERAGFFVTDRPDDFVRFTIGDPMSISHWDEVAAEVGRELGAEATWLGDDDVKPVLRLRTAEGQIEFDRFAFETRFGPTTQTLAGRRAWYVPIKEHLRDELLPSPTQLALFRRRDAAVRFERVYFRSPSKPWPGVGDILLFYVSPNVGLVGYARCTASIETDIGEAAERFGRLAVIAPGEAERAGRVHCIAFDNYHALSQPLAPHRLRTLHAWPPQGPVSIVALPAAASLMDVLAAGAA